MADQPAFDALNAAYAQDLFERYLRNPASVPDSWRAFFSDERAVEAAGLSAHAAPSSFLPIAVANGVPSPRAAADLRTVPTPGEATAPPSLEILRTVARAASVIQALRDHGHQLSQLDPLGSPPPGHPELDPTFYGVSAADLAGIPASVALPSAQEGESLADALERMRAAYEGTLGFQFEHLEDPERVEWLREQVESGAFRTALTAGESVELLRRLSHVEGLERFLHRAYLGQKRFSIEGNDMMVPMLDVALEGAAREGAGAAVIGMAHRGRLNVLAHLMGISYEALIGEFEGGTVKEGMLPVPDPGTGDVKYHLGASTQYTLPGGGEIQLTLAPNPSHLEVVNPVVSGMARALQYSGPGSDAVCHTAAVLPILIHGDAAFAGEGVVPEALNMARLAGYTTGGALHIICNNQVGFTTNPSDARSTRYASDLARGFDLPIIHVNADDPEACLAAVRLAVGYRSRFQDDVVIDLIGYRRHGHNEGDEPGYTQPSLYTRIEAHPTVRTLWARTLAERGILGEADSTAIEEEVTDRLRRAQDQVREAAERIRSVPPPIAWEAPVATALDLEGLSRVNAATVEVPDGFTIHPKLRRQFERRIRDFGPTTRLDWAHAEALAFGSLLETGTCIRFTGQDVERGTFSHRHLVLHDARTGVPHTPLSRAGWGRLELYNSPLTETAVVGFEYGYSVAAPDAMVLWEAQFGDFANVAQAIIDQFMAAGRSKWNQEASLVLLLPHGYEGQGPEHSSARLERFLQLCAEDNMAVASASTPAQYFHLLRRQALARPRRPLIVMNPKSLLRHPLAVSELSELAQGGFAPVIDDPSVDAKRRRSVRRLVLCTGKIFYDLIQHPLREESDDVAIARIEQLYPFPAALLEDILGRYPKLEEIVWVQEEPRNMGALTFVGPRLRGVAGTSIPLRYVSRPERASPAEGKAKNHQIEQNRIVEEALRRA